MVNESFVLEYYLKQVDADRIDFLKGRETFKKEISAGIKEMQQCHNLHHKVQTAKKLWKLLFEASMSHIEQNKHGYDNLFAYFDEYVEFEELIFASDSFYRDHTMHCLWVYFLSEYLYTKKEFDFIFKDMLEQINYATKIFNALVAAGILDRDNPSISAVRQFEKLSDCQGAVRCLTALTHDLGYPLKKIEKINRAIGKILPFFSIENFQKVAFDYNSTQALYIERFLEFISMDFHITVKQSNAGDHNDISRLFETGRGETITFNQAEIDKLTGEQIKAIRDSTRLNFGILKNLPAYSRYAHDFEQHRHGILSAFLLMKTLNFFKALHFSYVKPDELDIYHLDFYKVYAANIIVSAVSDHSSDGFQIKKVNNPSALLTFVDELEEFSRISRADQNRQFINEFCKTDIYVKNDSLCIDFIFDNGEIENLSPEFAFKGRCKRFLGLLDIKRLDEDFRLILRCIGRLPTDRNEYQLEIRRNYADISVNNVGQNIPDYLKSKQFYTKEEYMK